MDKIDILMDALEKRFAERAASKEAQKEKEAKEKEVKELKEKVEKLEKATKGDGVEFTKLEVGTPDRYKGFNFKAQFKDNPDLAPKDEKTRDKVVKEVLDIIYNFKMNGAPIVKQMGEDTAGSGHEFVAEEWVRMIEERARLVSVGLAGCRRYPMVNDVIHIPVQGTGVTVTWANEGAASTQNEPTSAEVSLNARRVGIWGSVSQELIDDAVADIVGFISRECIEALGQEVDSQVFIGGQFTGIGGLTANTVNIGASFANLSAQNFYDGEASLPTVRAAGAKWYMHRRVFGTVKGITTGTGGVPLVNYLGGPQAREIAGYPIELVEAMPSADATSTTFITFCNLQNYALGVRLLPTGIELNKWARAEFTQFQVLFRMYARIIGAPLFNDLFVNLRTS